MAVRSSSDTPAFPRRLCLALLQPGGVGRVGLTVRALPSIVPVRFALVDDEVVVSTRSSALALADGAVVAFQADGPDDGLGHWTISATGVAHVALGSDRERLARHLAPTAAGPAPVVRIQPELLEGRLL